MSLSTRTLTTRQTSPPRVARWLDRLAGRPETRAADPALGWRVVAGIAVFLVCWRMALLGLSVLWGSVGISRPWPADIDQMWLWRYSVRWDADRYLAIARSGYRAEPDAANVDLFPALPALTRVGDWILPGGDVLAALVVVHLALGAAALYVYRLVTLDEGELVAWRTLFLLLTYPAAFFYSAVYAESLLLLGLAGALYHARQGQWTRAAALGALASATKLLGCVVVVPLALEMWHQRGAMRPRPWPAVAVVLSLSGIVSYAAYLQLRFDDATAFLASQGTAGRDAFSPALLHGVAWLFGDRDAAHLYPLAEPGLRGAFVLLDTTLLWALLAAGVYLWLRVRPSYGALVLTVTLALALADSPQSAGRHVAVLFPAFILLGRIRNEAARLVLTLMFSLGLALTTYLFVQGYWAG